jgi:hypothetical protein
MIGNYVTSTATDKSQLTRTLDQALNVISLDVAKEIRVGDFFEMEAQWGSMEEFWIVVCTSPLTILTEDLVDSTLHSSRRTGASSRLRHKAGDAVIPGTLLQPFPQPQKENLQYILPASAEKVFVPVRMLLKQSVTLQEKDPNEPIRKRQKRSRATIPSPTIFLWLRRTIGTLLITRMNRAQPAAPVTLQPQQIEIVM